MIILSLMWQKNKPQLPVLIFCRPVMTYYSLEIKKIDVDKRAHIIKTVYVSANEPLLYISHSYFYLSISL